MGEAPPQLPVAHELEPDLPYRAYEEMAGQCEAFQASGSHDLRRDSSPTFMCPDWMGYGWHCISTRHWLDDKGWPCSDRCVYVELRDG